MKSMKATRWTREAILAAGNVFAFEGDDTGGTSDGGNSAADTSGTGPAAADSKDATTGSGSTEDEDPKVLKRKLENKTEEQDRQFKLWQADKKRADELQKKVDEEERKGKSELENAKTDLAAKDKVIAAKDDTIRRLTIENAFMTLKEIEWNNPATALRLVDLSEVEFDEETGRPKDRKQLLRAAKSLADSDPYLVKSKTDVSTGTPEGKPSGKAPATGKPKEVTDDAIKQKYNILR
jgi:hypothetical protein